MELDKVTSALIADRLAKYGGFSATWGAHTCIGTLPIIYFGTAKQKEKYLPGLASGEIVGAYALSESSSGSDALHCRAQARLSSDSKHYVLNGEKMWITNAGLPISSSCSPKWTARNSRPSLWNARSGFSVGAEEHKMGIRGSLTCPSFSTIVEYRWRTSSARSARSHNRLHVLNVGRAASWVRAR